jgi:hypothetical protein
MMRRGAPAGAASMTRFVSLTDERDMLLLPPSDLTFGDHMVTTGLDTGEIRRNEQTTAFFGNQHIN